MRSERVMLVFGTRPETIKMAPVYHALEKSGMSPLVCVTAQHREMLDQALAHFGITPDYDLDIMTPRQSLTRVATRVMDGVDDVISKASPDMLLVHGDTTTTFFAAMAAFHRRVPIAHVEAGLRTGDIRAPFPEEANRILADRICDLYLAPTAQAKANLLKERIDEESIFVTGNTAVDSLLWTVKPEYRFKSARLREMDWSDSRPLIAVEVHRRENWGEPMHRLGRALRRIANELPVRLVVSVHPNPEVSEVIPGHLEGLSNVVLHEPFEYPDWANLLSRCRFVVSDSGGVQEEAPSLGRPVLVCREKTERPEAVEAGTVELVGTDEDRILGCARELVHDSPVWFRMSQASNPYGDGRAGERTAEAVRFFFGHTRERPRAFGG